MSRHVVRESSDVNRVVFILAVNAKLSLDFAHIAVLGARNGARTRLVDRAVNSLLPDLIQVVRRLVTVARVVELCCERLTTLKCRREGKVLGRWRRISCTNRSEQR